MEEDPINRVQEDAHYKFSVHLHHWQNFLQREHFTDMFSVAIQAHPRDNGSKCIEENIQECKFRLSHSRRFTLF